MDSECLVSLFQVVWVVDEIVYSRVGIVGETALLHQSCRLDLQFYSIFLDNFWFLFVFWLFSLKLGSRFWKWCLQIILICLFQLLFFTSRPFILFVLVFPNGEILYRSSVWFIFIDRLGKTFVWFWLLHRWAWFYVECLRGVLVGCKVGRRHLCRCRNSDQVFVLGEGCTSSP